MTKEVVDSGRVLELLEGAPAQGLQVADITATLGLTRDQRNQVRAVLKKLIKTGHVVKRGRHFMLNSERMSTGETVEGLLSVTPSGYGYVDFDDAYEGVRVSASDLGGAIDGDRVALERTGQSAGRQAGRVVEILHRGRTRVVGTLEGGPPSGGKPHSAAAYPFRLAVDDVRLAAVPMVVQGAEALAAKAGQMALCEITAYPEHVGGPLIVTPRRVLGAPDSLSAAVERLMWEHGVPDGFPATVAALGAKAPQEVRSDDRRDRLDLRDRPFITIDPETARDFDDAVTVERRDDAGYRVWVAVADVSHYVPEDSPIDVEARLRSCSVYPPGGVVPMLPEQLSSGICSLNPEQDRLAMVVEMELDRGGQLLKRSAAAAVIRSRARLDYAGVAAALSGDLRGKRARYAEHLDQLELLAEVGEVLRGRRRKRGSLLELDLPEAKVLLDEDDPNRVRDMVQSREDPEVRKAYQLIEELMIAANEAVAEIFLEHERATLWRVHAAPKLESVERLAGQLEHYGLSFTPDHLLTPKGMARLLAKLDGHAARRSLAYLSLRALKQADYRAVHGKHFGLASEGYLHFTSPIRRYPDLHTHRLLKQLLRDQGLPAGGSAALRQRDEQSLSRIASEASATERRAMELERALTALYGAALMRDRVGDRFDGRVIGFSSFGIFVGLDEPFVEGMVSTDGYGGGMELDTDRMCMVGRRPGARLYLGDRFEVVVLSSSLERRRIELGVAVADRLGAAPPAARPKAVGKYRGAARRPGPPKPGKGRRRR